jgi:hypothetical protein
MNSNEDLSGWRKVALNGGFARKMQECAVKWRKD